MEMIDISGTLRIEKKGADAQITFRLPSEQARRLGDICTSINITTSDILRALVNQFIESWNAGTDKRSEGQKKGGGRGQQC
jgi:predicted transcriptional regulator